MQNVIWWLLAAFIIFTLLRKRFFMFNNKNVKNINADEGYKLINENKNMIILDVRTKGEFESGHIPKAKNIPVQQLSTRIKELEKYKDVPILVHCASGGRSPSAVRALAKNNFTQVYHLNKGLMSWKHQLKK
ncbi:rhodanese-like domain-containing protein [Clostridium rhizosphaerae]|nr:rhodanese-like domain-containing protein [Clostridium rhizosphaerae]